VARRVDRRGHQADAQHRTGRGGVGADLLVEWEERRRNQGGGGAADERHAHEQHRDGQQNPSHGAELYPKEQVPTSGTGPVSFRYFPAYGGPPPTDSFPSTTCDAGRKTLRRRRDGLQDSSSRIVRFEAVRGGG